MQGYHLSAYTGAIEYTDLRDIIMYHQHDYICVALLIYIWGNFFYQFFKHIRFITAQTVIFSLVWCHDDGFLAVLRHKYRVLLDRLWQKSIDPNLNKCSCKKNIIDKTGTHSDHGFTFYSKCVTW